MKIQYQIFISYRHDGGEYLARLLEYKLTARGFKVFFDVESLRSGPFDKTLFEKIAECTDILVVLPPNGLDRCTDPEDWVRLEVARALQLNKKIIPITMKNFKFPATLPENINQLRYMQGIEANNDFFEFAIEKLVSKFLDSKPFNSNDQLQKEADEGNPSAMNTLGLRYESGESLPIIRQKAFEFYTQAAAEGDSGALYNLGDVYEQCAKDLSLTYDYGIAEKISQKNADESRNLMRQLAADCYTKAADKKFAPAFYRLGNLAEDVQDFEKAIKFYQSAAVLNYPPAQNAMGYYKMHGIKTNIDFKEAVAWYEQAVNAGYLPAVYNYAHAIELKNAKKAAQLYEKVVNIIPQAALPLARLYENSLHDLQKASNYYRIAYEVGIQEAGESLRRCQDILLGNKKIEI